MASYPDGHSAYIAASILDAEGIPYLILDEHTIGIVSLWSQAVGGVKVQVPDDLAAEARQLLLQDHSADVPEPEPERCPRCGSPEVHRSRLRHVAGALGLLIGLPLVAWSHRRTCRTCGNRWDPRDDAGPLA